MLIKHLGPQSAYWRARAGAEDWSPTEYLLADVFDVLALANWQRVGDKDAQKPKPYPRPGETKRREDDLRAKALAMRRRNRTRGGAA